MSKKVILFDNFDKNSCPFFSRHDRVSSEDMCMCPSVMEDIDENFCFEKCPVPDYHNPYLLIAAQLEGIAVALDVPMNKEEIKHVQDLIILKVREIRG